MKALLVILLTVQNAFAYAQLQVTEKIAVIIGVSTYEAIPPLKNCVNDANDIAEKLIKFGFRVILLLDADQEEIIRKLDSLKKTLKPGDVFLFYFSGHGLEMNNEIFLFPRNSMPTSEKDLPKETVALGKVLQVIKEAKIKTGIIILDACRSNNVVRTWKGRTPKEGLSKIDTPAGIFIGYAAAPGHPASGGIRTNSLYTEAILKFIELENISIDELFTKVNKEVREQSLGVQVPHKTSSLEEEFYFNRTNPGLPLEFKNVSLDSVARSIITKRKYEQKDSIQISLDLKEGNNWSNVSPVWVKIVSRAMEDNGRSVFSDKFVMEEGKNLITISKTMERGTYELMIGVYLLADLDKDNPTMYSKKFCFVVM